MKIRTIAQMPLMATGAELDEMNNHIQMENQARTDWLRSKNGLSAKADFLDKEFHAANEQGLKETYQDIKRNRIGYEEILLQMEA
jgi:hypothetical protein